MRTDPRTATMHAYRIRHLAFTATLLLSLAGGVALIMTRMVP